MSESQGIHRHAPVRSLREDGLRHWYGLEYLLIQLESSGVCIREAAQVHQAAKVPATDDVA
jgi:hypothetical protein